MKTTPLACLALGAAALTLAGALAGCGASQAAKADAYGVVGAAAATPATLFTVPSDQLSHVQVAPAATANWPNLLRLTGNVDYNQFATTPVISQISGPVSQILAVPGQQVRQGEPLLEVSSPDFAQARNTFLKARDAYALADRIYVRDQDLLAHQAIAQADLEQAESTRTQAQADLDAAQQALRILGFPDPNESVKDSPMAQIAVNAPISGEVVDREVSPGQLLQGGATQCFTISDMKTVWVLANIYQSDLAHVQVGDQVEIETNAYARKFSGKISFINPALDPNSRTLQARIETDNPGQVLKKDMYVTATVRAGTLRDIVVVPNASVLRDDQNVPFVYVQSAPGQFGQRTVSIGPSENGFTQITAGLKAGEPVVGNGGIFLQFAKSLQQ